MMLLSLCGTVCVALMVASLGLVHSAQAIRLATAQMSSVSKASPSDTVAANVAIVLSLAESAVNANASFVAFPEFSLVGSFDFSSCTDPSAMQAYAEPLGDNGTTIDCTSTFPLAAIGCSSAAKSLTVSYNTVEGNGDGNFYNTQVIVHNGVLVAKYRKFNVFYKKCFTSPLLELVTFSVENVLFGVFTCYDILFDHPKQDLVALGVKYFSYSSAIPLIGTDAVKLFSALNSVNVVSSDASAGQSAIVSKGLTIARAPKSGNVVTVADL